MPTDKETLEENPGYLECHTPLTRLPEGLSVFGNIDLNGCAKLTGVPKGLAIKADFAFAFPQLPTE